LPNAKLKPKRTNDLMHHRIKLSQAFPGVCKRLTCRIPSEEAGEIPGACVVLKAKFPEAHSMRNKNAFNKKYNYRVDLISQKIYTYSTRKL